MTMWISRLLGLLENLTRIGKGIKVHSVSDYCIKENFNVAWNFDKVKNFNSEIRNCFIFTSNVRVENALINTKLRVKFLHKNFDIVGIGLATNSNFSYKLFKFEYTKSNILIRR